MRVRVDGSIAIDVCIVFCSSRSSRSGCRNFETGEASCQMGSNFDDRRLLRFLGYIRQSADDALTGVLSTEDENSAVLRLWPDADLAGNSQ